MRRYGAVLAALGLLVAACGDDDDEDASDNGGETTTTTAGAAGGGGGEGDLDTDATLVLSWPVGPESFDPHRAGFFTGYPYQSPIIEQLVHYPGPGELEGELAESWEFSEDGLSLELSLREGVEFHDGTPFDGEAVKANIERARDLPESTAARRLGAIESIDVVDEHTVVLNLGFPDASLPAAFATNAGSMISPASFDDPQVDQNPVGTGPYRLASAELGDRATYERIAEYGEHWDPDAGKAATVEIVGIGDPEARENALRSGQIDAAYILTDRIPQAMDLVQETEGLVSHLYRSENRTALLFNRTVEPLDDPRVRQAISYAIDRQTLIDALLGGDVAAAQQLFIEGNLGHVPELQGHYDYDPDRARELLEEAGFADGLTLAPVFVSEQAGDQAQVVQEMLADVGIDMQLETQDSGEFLTLWADAEAPAAFGFLAPEIDPGNFLDRLLSDEFDFAGITDEFADLAQRAKDSTLSRDERDELYQEINRIHTEEAWNVLVAHLDIMFVADEHVVGLETMPYSDLSIWDPRYLGVTAE